jgi:hypothetical protein
LTHNAGHGLWEYTTPGAGGAEHYSEKDYVYLLDDMAEHDMYSLLLVVKWFTTGYRSGLEYLDQEPSNPVVRSDNELLHHLLAEAQSRQIEVTLGAVTTMFPVKRFAGRPHTRWTTIDDFPIPEEIGAYDIDDPAVATAATEIAEEIVTLFPSAHGLMIELEFAGIGTAARQPAYDAWAADRGRPTFAAITSRLEPRRWDDVLAPWREYTTETRLDLLRRMEAAVRHRGFQGQLHTICETGNREYSLNQEMDLDLVAAALPDWTFIFYEYYKWRHRRAILDLCIEQPRQKGLKSSYLARGLLTWSDGAGAWPLPISLRESWRRDMEDIAQFQPEFVWWFGAGGAGEGAHCIEDRLRSEGFTDARDARRALLATTVAENEA